MRRMMKMTEDQFLIINGLRYRKPHLVSHHNFERLENVGLDLLEKLHNFSSVIARIEGFQRDQRFTHSMPETILWLLETNDEGASVVASITYLETHGFIIRRKADS
jgi:hypothetical protein